MADAREVCAWRGRRFIYEAYIALLFVPIHNFPQLSGEYGMTGVALSVPVMLRRERPERIFPLELDDQEVADMLYSGRSLAMSTSFRCCCGCCCRMY